jgi:hypothetical protein
VKFLVDIDSDDAALGDIDGGGAELIELLQGLVDRLPYESAPTEGFLRDGNGNRVGRWRWHH